MLLYLLPEEKGRKDSSERVPLQGDRIYMVRAPPYPTEPHSTHCSNLSVVLCGECLDQGSALCVTWITYVLEPATPDTLMNHVYFEVIESKLVQTALSRLASASSLSYIEV